MPPGDSPRSRSNCASSQSIVASPAALSTFGRIEAVETRLHDRHEVAIAELGIDGVDPDIEQSLSWMSQRIRYHRSGGGFLGDRDSVFEIEDHRVGIE